MALRCFFAAIFLFATAAAVTLHRVAPLEKAVTLLTELKKNVYLEGLEEAKAHDKFVCFCQDNLTTTAALISTANDDITSHTASIQSGFVTLATKQTAIAEAEAARTQKEEELQQLKFDRKRVLQEYELNAADLMRAVQALDGAIRTLKTARMDSSAFLQSQRTIHQAVLLAKAMGLGGKAPDSAAALLQTQDPQSNAFHSDEIITYLETLRTDFSTVRDTVDQGHQSAMADMNLTHQALDNDLAVLSEQIAASSDEIVAIKQRIAASNEMLSITKATQQANQIFYSSLVETCNSKKALYSQRTRLRLDEVNALAQALEILENENVKNSSERRSTTVASVQRSSSILRNAIAVQAIEESAEAADAAAKTIESSMSFLQKSVTPNRVAKLEAFLRRKGIELKSPVISALATQVENPGFEKVATLIKELVLRLQSESQKEQSHDSWCRDQRQREMLTKEKAEADIKRGVIRQEELELDIKQMNVSIAELKVKINNSYSALAEAAEMRRSDMALNSQILNEAGPAKLAVLQAKAIIVQFYQVAAKAGVAAPQQPTNETNGAYQGKQESAVGIVAMLDVVLADVDREIAERTGQEQSQQEDYVEFGRIMQSSMRTDATALRGLQSEQFDAIARSKTVSAQLSADRRSLAFATEMLEKLQVPCVNNKETYAEKKARLENEIAALKEAMGILQKYDQ